MVHLRGGGSGGSRGVGGEWRRCISTSATKESSAIAALGHSSSLMDTDTEREKERGKKAKIMKRVVDGVKNKEI